MKMYLLGLCLVVALFGHQEQAPQPAKPQQPDEQKAAPEKDDKKSNGATNHSASKPAAKSPKTKQAPPTSATSVPTAHPPSLAEMILDALEVAAQSLPAGAPAHAADVASRAKALRSRFAGGEDPAVIAREGAGLLADLYLPEKRAPDAPAGNSSSGAWRPFDVLLTAILVSLLSPLVCVFGFWLGSRAAENGVRKTLREAGLL